MSVDDRSFDPHHVDAETGLPSYASPPVTEVAVSVTFEELPPQVVVRYGEWWSKTLRAEFPVVSEQAPYEAPQEDFNGSRRVGIDLQIVKQLPRPRLWFVSGDESELIQLQGNWLACNWRKTGPSETYGRWPARRETFEKWLTSFADWCQEQEVQPRFGQWELTYVNHIEPTEGLWSSHAEAANLLTPLSGARDLPNADIEQTSWQAQYRIRGGEARLRASLQPVFRLDNDAPMYVLELTARGLYAGSEITELMGRLDVGREAIVSSFAALTTGEAQQKWGRQ